MQHTHPLDYPRPRSAVVLRYPGHNGNTQLPSLLLLFVLTLVPWLSALAQETPTHSGPLFVHPQPPPLDLPAMEAAGRLAILRADQRIVELVSDPTSSCIFAPTLLEVASMLEHGCNLLALSTTEKEQIWPHCDALLLGWIDTLLRRSITCYQTCSPEQSEGITHDIEATLDQVKLHDTPKWKLENPLCLAATMLFEDYARMLITWALRQFAVVPDSPKGKFILDKARIFVGVFPLRDPKTPYHPDTTAAPTSVLSPENNNAVRPPTTTPDAATKPAAFSSEIHQASTITINPTMEYIRVTWDSYCEPFNMNDTRLVDYKKAQAFQWLDDTLWGVRMGYVSDKPKLTELTQVARDTLFPKTKVDSTIPPSTGTVFFKLELKPTYDETLTRCSDVIVSAAPGDESTTGITITEDRIELPAGEWTLLAPDNLLPKVRVVAGSAQLVSRPVPCSIAPHKIKNTPDILLGATVNVETERFVFQLGPSIPEFANYSVLSRLVTMRITGDFISGTQDSWTSHVQVFSTVRSDTDSFIEKFWEVAVGVQLGLETPVAPYTRAFLHTNYQARLRNYDARPGLIGNDVVGWIPLFGVLSGGFDVLGAFFDLRGVVSHTPWLSVTSPLGKKSTAETTRWELGGGFGYVGRDLIPNAQFGIRVGAAYANYNDTVGPTPFEISNLRLDTRFTVTIDVMPIRIHTTAGIDWFGGTPNITGAAFHDKLAILSDTFAPSLNFGLGFAWCAQRCQNTQFPQLSPWEISGDTP